MNNFFIEYQTLLELEPISKFIGRTGDIVNPEENNVYIDSLKLISNLDVLFLETEELRSRTQFDVKMVLIRKFATTLRSSGWNRRINLDFDVWSIPYHVFSDPNCKFNSQIPEDLLRRYSTYYASSVRESIAYLPYTPTSILDEMTYDYNSSVQRIAYRKYIERQLNDRK